MDLEANQGTNEVVDAGNVQSQDQGAANSDQSVSSTVGEFEIGGEKFTVDTLKNSYGELRKKFTQESQKIAEERRANEWLTGRLRELHTGSPEDWKALKAILNGQKVDAVQAQAKVAQGQAQAATPDPRLGEFEKAQRLTDAKLEIMEFQRSHPDQSEDQIKDLVQFVVKQDVEGRNYSLEDAFIIKNHKSQIANAATSAQKKTEDSLKKGQAAAALGTAATTAQVPDKKPKNFRKIKDENSVNEYFMEKLKKAGAKFDD